MKFSKIVFLVAGVEGLVILLPQYFLERSNGITFPPPITHPEYFYGFVGVALAFQIVFLIISRDPVRYRPIMIAGVIEKFSFTGACLVLYFLGRTNGIVAGFSIPDLVLGILFIAAFVKTGGEASGSLPEN